MSTEAVGNALWAPDKRMIRVCVVHMLHRNVAAIQGKLSVGCRVAIVI